mmetsp:Transcript_50958/g.122874  ORF Transcript_50958/g.122874 Transcript_50958/m.122874 type:complete len:225 (+) Transcript_50958:173-847(+)
MYGIPLPLWGPPHESANRCPSTVVTCRFDSGKSFIVPTKTLGTSGKSPRELNNASFTCPIISYDCRDPIENTRIYPCTPNDAFLDNRENSSIPAVSTMSVWKCTFRNRIVLWKVFSIVGWCCVENDPETNEFTMEDFPTARKPSIATFRWTNVGCRSPVGGGVVVVVVVVVGAGAGVGAALLPVPPPPATILILLVLLPTLMSLLLFLAASPPADNPFALVMST